MDNQQERLVRLGWAGGIVDGEGNITISTRNDKRRKNPLMLSPLFKMSNTSIELIDLFGDVLANEGLTYWRGNPNKTTRSEKYKPQEIIVVSGFKRMQRFLDKMKPFIKIKWKQVELVQCFINHRMKKDYHANFDDFELLLVKEIRKINQRGVVLESSETNTLDTDMVMIESVLPTKAEEKKL